MPEYVRVLDKDTGHKLTVTKLAVPHGNYDVLKDAATDPSGAPLPPEHGTNKVPTVETTTSGQKADTLKEKANG